MSVLTVLNVSSAVSNQKPSTYSNRIRILIDTGNTVNSFMDTELRFISNGAAEGVINQCTIIY